MRRFVLPLVLCLAPALAGAQRPLLLVPQPREAVASRDIVLAHGLEIAIPADSADAFAARDLHEALTDAGVRIVSRGGSARITLLRAGGATARRLLARHAVVLDSAMHDEGYALVPDGTTLAVVASTPAGVFYGAQTVKQLVEGRGTLAVLRMATVRDWPAMRYRGLHDDLSRGPVPTLDFMKRQMRIFAAYKLNVYSPYFEHTLAYRSNPLVAPPGGSLSRDDVRELVAYAGRYHIDVIPEQEAFGHLHHMLKYELYSPLAETPHGHVLAPDQPGSMTLIKQWFAEIDTLFPSRFVHLGADETFELGRGQTADRVTKEGIGPVYLGFLHDIVAAIGKPDKRYLFWGDFAVRSPELVKSLPKQMIAVPWSYGAGTSYDREILPFRQAGLETWVAPGVSNWSRVYPNFNTAFVNIRNFIRDGQRLGATGVLITTWDDDGEALFNQTWMGVVFGAAASWQPGESDVAAFQRSYGRAFYRDTTGRVDAAERLMMAAHSSLAGAGLGNGSDALFWQDPFSVDGQATAEKIRPFSHDLRVEAESAMVYVAQLRTAGPVVNEDALAALELGARKMDFIGMKFQFADEIRSAYAHASDSSQKNGMRELGDISGVNGRMQDLRDGYELTRELYQAAWLRENRPYWLQNVLAKYDMAMQLWLSRADRFAQTRSEQARTKRLPGFDAAEIPAPVAPPPTPAAAPASAP
jgi:hexosaminidase